MAMKAIDIARLQTGTIAEADFYSDRGELLISKGVGITDRHLDMLQKRNIFEVYVKPQSEADELQEILSQEMKQLGELQFDNDDSQNTPSPQTPPGRSRQEQMGIKEGAEGYEQLKNSAVAVELDRQLKDQKTPDRPFGPSLESRSTVKMPADRTEEYKADVFSHHGRALEEVVYLLDAIADGSIKDGQPVRSIAERFVKLFVTDRNILLNLSRIKHDGVEHVYVHSLNVCLISINIAASYGYNENQVIEVGMGALLHDVGMLLIPKEVRCKQGKLSENEWYEILKHPILGLHLLEKLRLLPASVPFVSYQVHERVNGRGYPKQRSGKLIHRFAKLVQVADVFEALSSPRPHRQQFVPYKAMEGLIKMTRTGLLSEEFVKAFLAYASLFPVGSFVQISNGCIGKVIAANKTSFAKPTLSILTDSKGNLLPRNEIYQVDLHANKDVQIVKALSVDYLEGVELMDGF